MLSLHATEVALRCAGRRCFPLTAATLCVSGREPHASVITAGQPVLIPMCIHFPRSPDSLQLVVLVCIVRVPKQHSQLHTVFRCYLTAVMTDLLWRRLLPGSHARWRHALLPAFALCDVLMSRHGVVRAGLDLSAAVPGGGVRDALHHALLLVLASRFTSNLFLWGLCHPAK